MSHRPPRVLVFTAGVGAGHEIPARAIGAGILARRPDAEVVTADAFDALGPALKRVAEQDMRRTFGSGRLNWVFDLQYLLFARFAPGRSVGRVALHRATGTRVLRFVQERVPDVVVSPYPALTETLGFLRRSGRLRTPVVAVITDLSSLWYWAARGVDLHLVTHPESIPEAERISRAHHVRAAVGMHDERFLDPPPAAEARRALGLPADASVVAVSGGGWGVGDVEGACRIAIEGGAANVLCLCGRNDELRAQVERAFAGDRRVRALPFVDDMVTPLAAADVLVHSTAGLTVLEALLVGARPISYGWGIAHIRGNNRAYRRLGLAQVASTPTELRAAVHRALTAERRPLAPEFRRLPNAADLILGLAPAHEHAR